MSITNLESICARYGYKIAEIGKDKPSDMESLVTKALGVLAENGFYAMNVFLLSCNLRAHGEKMENELINMLCDKELALLEQPKAGGVDSLPDLHRITEDLPRLILARRVTEQALTFARYHCKAMGKAEKAKGNN